MHKVILSSGISIDYGLEFEIYSNDSGVSFHYQQNQMGYPNGFVLLDITCERDIFRE